MADRSRRVGPSSIREVVGDEKGKAEGDWPSPIIIRTS